MTTLNTAIELAENGFEVFTLKPDGKPYTENGFKNATRDPNLIMEAWEKHPDALIGVFTGASGVIVLDLDYKVDGDGNVLVDGFESIAEAWYEIPDTFAYDSRNGLGRHMVYRAPEGNYPRSMGYRGMKGVDRCSGNGYVAWMGGVPAPEEIADAPEWLLDQKEARSTAQYEGTLKTWYEDLTPGVPNALVRKAMERATKKFEELGNDFSHSDFVELQFELVRLGAEANPGVPEALNHLEELFMSREGAHSRPEDEWAGEWAEALQSAIEKYGDAIELLKSLPEYDLSLVPKEIPDGIVQNDTGKPGFSKLLAALVKATQDDLRITSILWNCPATTALSREWGLQFVHKRVLDARVKPEPTRENPRIEEQREIAHVAPELSSTDLLTPEEREYISKRPTFVDHVEAMAKEMDYDQFAYFRAAGWSVLSMATSFQGFVPEGGAGKHGLNFWNTIIGDSGTGKTLVQQIRDMMLRKIFEHERGAGVPYYDLGSDSSPQGLHAALLERDMRASILSGDEAADFFMSIKNQKNNASFPETLTKWSNGDVPPANKMTMKDDLKGKAAKTAFSMQFFSTRKNLIASLDRGMFEKGFLARMTWTLGKPKPKTDDIYNLTQPEETVTMESLPPEIEALVSDLLASQALMGRNNVELKATPEALRRMSEAYMRMDKVAQVRMNYELTGPSVIRLKDTMLKCAGMCALYRCDTTITEQDALHSIRAVEEWFTNLFIVAGWVSEGDFQRACAEIESWIRDQKGAKATGTRIKHRFKNKIVRDPRELDNYLIFLVESGILNREEENGSVVYVVNGGVL